jgi:hypothetical protein
MLEIFYNCNLSVVKQSSVAQTLRVATLNRHAILLTEMSRLSWPCARSRFVAEEIVFAFNTGSYTVFCTAVRSSSFRTLRVECRRRMLLLLLLLL